MKHGSLKQTSSTYKLVEKSEDDEELGFTPDHPTYEEMITLALEQSRSKKGVDKPWILRKIVEKWKLRQPYATNNLEKTLKRMRKDKLVKRTPGGLIVMSKKRTGKVSSSKAKTTKKSRSVQFKSNASRKMHRALNNIDHDNQISRWNMQQMQQNKPDNRYDRRRAGVCSMNHTLPGEQSASDSDAGDGGPSYKENPNFQRLKFRQQVHTSSEDEESQVSRYNLGHDWPLHAETDRTDLATMKNNIRQILLDNNAIHGNPGMSQEEVVCAIVLELGHSQGLSTLTHRKVRPQVEKALLHMRDSQEVVRCSFKNTYSLPEEGSRTTLKDRNMRKFIEERRSAGSTPASLLMEAAQYFSGYTFEEVNRCFNNTIQSMNEPTDDEVDSCDEKDEFFTREAIETHTSKSSKEHLHNQQSTSSGLQLGGGDQTGESGGGVAREQLRLTCPCCNNELLITIRYNK